eukprot:scaffold78367_cov35-Phaeocystis_antarctica.AAC.1
MASCLAAGKHRHTGEVGFPRRSIAHRRSPLVVRGRLHELRCRARPRLPRDTLPAQHQSPHLVGCRIVRRRPHNPRRQRLEPLVASAVATAQSSEPAGARSLASRYRCAASTWCPELSSATPRL